MSCPVGAETTVSDEPSGPQRDADGLDPSAVPEDVSDDERPTDPGEQGELTDPGPMRDNSLTEGIVDDNPPPPVVPDTPWRSLHPMSLAVNLIPQAWRTGRAAWPLLLVVFFGGRGSGVGLEAVDLTMLVAFFGLTIVRTVTHFMTLRYRVHDGRFEVRSGLLNRRARVLDPARIQNIEAVQNLFHKAAGLIEVRVETAGDASTQGLLSALSTDEAARLEAELRGLVRAAQHADAPADPSAPAAPLEEPLGELLIQGSVLETIAYGLSRRTVGTVAVLTLVGFEILGQLGPQAEDEARWIMQPQVFVPALLLAFAGSWAWSAGRSLFKHWRFTLRRRGDRLVNEEGLTTRRRVEIPLKKVQLLRIDEPLTRRTMGYGTLLVETAALGFADGELRQAEGVVPMVPRADLPALVRAVSPMVSADPWATPLLPPHRRALFRAIVFRLARSTVLAVLLIVFAAPWGWAALALIPLAPFIAWLDWRWQGWRVTDDAVITRRGVFKRSTWVLARDKIQSVQVLQAPLMRPHGLATVVVQVAGTAIALPDIGIADALRVLQDLSRDTPPPPDGATP